MNTALKIRKGNFSRLANAPFRECNMTSNFAKMAARTARQNVNIGCHFEFLGNYEKGQNCRFGQVSCTTATGDRFH